MAIKKSKSRISSRKIIPGFDGDTGRIKIFAAVAAIVIIAAVFVYYQPQQDAEGTQSADYAELLEGLRETWSVMDNPDRTTYPIPIEIFDALPPVPSDFGEIDYMLVKGRLFAIGVLGEEYYKQPEFYPRFEEFFSYWTDPNLGMWGTNGYGTYPADQWTEVRAGDSFTAYAFFHTSWNVQTWQGVQLVPAFPAEGAGEFYNTMSPSELKNYFDVTIEPNLFLLDPTFPAFGYNWAYKIEVRVDVAPDTPPGRYVVGFGVAKPPQEKAEEWGWEHRNFYFDASGMISVGRPQLRMMVTVV